VNEERDNRKVGIVLAAPGSPPPDSLEKNRELWEKLATGIRQRCGYQITEVGYSEFTHPTVEGAIERAISQGAQRIIVVPTMYTAGGIGTEVDIPDAVATSQKRHPEAEIVYTGPPVDYDRQVELILSKVREYDQDVLPVVSEEEGLTRLNMLEPGDVGIVHDLTGGRGFIGRLAALGFTPGAEVRMIQNFGHGPLIISIRDTRIALGRKEARKVRVKPSIHHQIQTESL
jgi:ferrous iron transport protein A